MGCWECRMKEGPPTLKGLESGQTQGQGHLKLSPSPAAPAPTASLCCPIPGGGRSSRETVPPSPTPNRTATAPSLPAGKWGPSSSSSKGPRSRYTCPGRRPDLGHAPGHWPTGNKTARGGFLDERLRAALGKVRRRVM